MAMGTLSRDLRPNFSSLAQKGWHSSVPTGPNVTRKLANGSTYPSAVRNLRDVIQLKVRLIIKARLWDWHDISLVRISEWKKIGAVFHSAISRPPSSERLNTFEMAIMIAAFVFVSTVVILLHLKDKNKSDSLPILYILFNFNFFV